MSILERIEYIKNRIKEIAEESLKQGLLTNDEFKGIVENIEKEKVKIGVVGQIKNGKTTLLNALIFGKPVLPAATTPMTASLSYLTYGKKASVEVEFFTKEEWKEIEELAKEKHDSEEVKYSIELVEKASRIKNELNSLLGKKREIDFNELHNYVGENGKYVPVTKALTIQYPNEILKGTDIVDTPGFNDPIISREHRAKQFLSSADVVIVLLYAGRPFDAADKDLLFTKIKLVGAGKVVVVMNKKDIVMVEQGTEGKSITHVKNKYREAIEKMEKDEEGKILSEIFKKTRIISLSSLMALLGKMDKKDIESDEDLRFHHNRLIKEFPQLKSPEDFLKVSGLFELEKEIDEIIKNEKISILVKKSITFILGKYKENRDKLNERIYGLETEEKSLSRTLPEIKEELTNLEKIKKEIKNHIAKDDFELKEELKQIKGRMKSEIRSIVLEVSKQLDDEIRDKKFFEWHSTYSSYVSRIVETQLIRLKRRVEEKLESFQQELYQKVKSIIDNIDLEMTNLANRYLTYTSADIIELKDKFLGVLDENLEISISDKIYIETSGWWFIGTKGAKSEAIKQAIKQLDMINNDFIEAFDRIYQFFNGNIQYIKQNFEKTVMDPITEALESAERNYKDKEKRKKEINSERDILNNQVSELDKKIKNIEDEMASLLEGNI
jgi:predicted GTPase/cation transport regulator ChaB